MAAADRGARKPAVAETKPQGRRALKVANGGGFAFALDEDEDDRDADFQR